MQRWNWQGRRKSQWDSGKHTLEQRDVLFEAKPCFHLGPPPGPATVTTNKSTKKNTTQNDQVQAILET